MTDNGTLFGRAQSRKISQFPADTVLPSDTQLTFIADGTNFRISVADFLTALNVTGSIASLGDGLQIYNLSGTVNNIRAFNAVTGLFAQQGTSGNIEIFDAFSKTIIDATTYVMVQTSEVVYCTSEAVPANIELLASAPTDSKIEIHNDSASQVCNISTTDASTIIRQGASAGTSFVLPALRSITLRKAPSLWSQTDYDPA